MAAAGADDDSLLVVWFLLERHSPAAAAATAQRGDVPNGAAAGTDADVDGARLVCQIN